MKISSRMADIPRIALQYLSAAEVATNRVEREFNRGVGDALMWACGALESLPVVDMAVVVQEVNHDE